jgi:hypothetical protein
VSEIFHMFNIVNLLACEICKSTCVRFKINLQQSKDVKVELKYVNTLDHWPQMDYRKKNYI